MKSTVESKALKKALLGGVSIMAFTVAVGYGGVVLADGASNADATTPIIDTNTITATDASGLDYDTQATGAITIDSDTAAITLGARDTTDAITNVNGGATSTLTVNIDTTGTNNTVTFAGDIDAQGDESIVINALDTTTVFEGDVDAGTGAVSLTVGSGTSTLSTTFDTATNANNTIDMTIDASAAGDTITVNVTNTENTTGNTVTFSKNIGGIEGIDVLALDARTTTVFDGTVTSGSITIGGTSATFNGDVVATSIAFSGTNVIFDGAVTGDVALSSTGTLTLQDAATITGDVDKTSGLSTAGNLVIEDQTTGAITAVSGAIGASNALNSITVDITTNDVTFGGAVSATTITVTGDDSAQDAIFQGDVTGAIVIDTDAVINLAADIKVVGSVATNTDGAGTLDFDTATAGTTLVSGAIGASGGNALEEVIVNTGAGVTSTFGGTVDADTVTLSGTGSVIFQDTVTADTKFDFTGALSVTFATDKGIVGDVTTSVGSQGSLSFSASTDTTFVDGDVGNLSSVITTIGAGAVGLFDGDLNADTTTALGAGTLSVTGDVVGDVDLLAAGTFLLAADKTITGDVDNTSGTAGTGTLTFGTMTGDLTLITGDIGDTDSLAQVTVDNGGSIATLDGDAAATAFTATGGGSTILNGAGTFTTLTTDGDFTSGTGVLDVVGTIALTGGDLIVGSGGAALGGASVTADNITLDSGKDVTFDGTVAQTVTGLVDGIGNVTISNAAGVTFANNVGATIDIDLLTIGTGKSATFNGTLDADAITLSGTGSTLQIEDTVTLTAGAGTGTGTITTAAGSKIIIGAGIVATETAFVVADVVSAGTTTIEVSSSFTTGTIVLFDSTADASGDLANLTITDTGLVDYTLAANGNDIEITAAARTDAAAAAALGVSTQDAVAAKNAALAIATGNDTLLANFDAALKAGGDDAAKAAETAAVQADTLGAGTNVAISTGGTVIGISSDRLGSLRTGNQFETSAATGFATGDNGSKYGVWFKPFGNWAEQDNTSGVAGFEALTYGVAMGADTEIADRYRAGGSFAYASSEIDGSGAGESTAEIDSYQFTAYGDYTGKNYYAEASLGYAYNKNLVSRVIDFMGTDTKASGDYGSSQFIASFNTGVPLQMHGTAYFTPTAGLAWTHVISESYTETGAGGLNQTVDIDDIDVLLGSLGAKMHTQIRYHGGYLVPNIHGSVSYDFIGDNTTATATYTGGGAAFTVEGADVEQFGGNLGFGFTYESGNFWTIGANYDADMKSGFISHSALFEARFNF